MTTELVILLAILAFLVGGVFYGDSSPRATFLNVSPKLGARLEREVETGAGFTDMSLNNNVTYPVAWKNQR